MSMNGCGPFCFKYQSLEPIYKKLGEKFKKLSPNVVIAKMDATANDKMPGFEVSGFPTIYFAPKDNKDKVRGYCVESCLVIVRSRCFDDRSLDVLFA